jgi:hypothetical protein
MGIAGKGHRLGGREGFTDNIPSSSRFPDRSSSRKQQHQVDRDALLAAAERRAAGSSSKPKEDVESNIEEV